MHLNATCPDLEEKLKPKVFDLLSKPIQLVNTKHKGIQNNLGDLKCLDLRPVSVDANVEDEATTSSATSATSTSSAKRIKTRSRTISGNKRVDL